MNKKTKIGNSVICMCKQLVDHCTTVPDMICWTNFVISKPFFSSVDAVWSWWSCIYHEFKYTFEEIGLSAFFKAISHYFGFNWPIDVDKLFPLYSFTEFCQLWFGGELGNQQRPTFERILYSKFSLSVLFCLLFILIIS